jgi:hypothetical protein
VHQQSLVNEGIHSDTFSFKTSMVLQKAPVNQGE